MHISSDTRKNIENWVDQNAQRVIEDLQEFCRVKSVSVAQDVPGSPFGEGCREMLDVAKARAESYGFKTIDHEGYCLSVYEGDLNSAIGIFGHLDVVPEGDQWIYPPYGATRVDDFLIGRGVSDNKGACVMGLHLLRMLRELRLPMKHGVRVVMGLSEETGMRDIQHFAKHEVMPVISLVPDSHFPVNYAQKGTLSANIAIKLTSPVKAFTGGEVRNMVPPHAQAVLDLPIEDVKAALPGFEVESFDGGARVIARGVAAHAAAPEAGESAIYALADALSKCTLLPEAARAEMAAIADISRDYYGAQAQIACEDPETNKTTMVIGVSKMDAARAVLTVDCRLSIAADLDLVEKNFRAYAEKMGFEVVSLETGKPFYMKKDDPRITALMDVYREITGDDAPPYTMGGGTYSRYLKNALTFGPGFEGDKARPDLPEHHGGAHAPDEYTYLPSFFKAMKIYALSLIELDAIV